MKLGRISVCDTGVARTRSNGLPSSLRECGQRRDNAPAEMPDRVTATERGDRS